MKHFLILSVAFMAACVSARPRYLVIPLEDVEFMGEQQSIPIYPMQQQQHHRSARSVPQYVPVYNVPYGNPMQRWVRSAELEHEAVEAKVANGKQGGPGGNRREDPISGEEIVAPGSFIGAINAAGIKSAEDSLAAGSNSYNSPPQGSDYVDYGAYTGKKGAFGWYSDHPVLLSGGGYH